MKNDFSKQVKVKRKILNLYLRIKYFLWIAIFLSCIIFFFSKFFKVWQAKLKEIFIEYTAKQGFIIEEIHVENLTNLTTFEIQNLLQIDKKHSIFELNLKHIYKILKSHPLVQDVILERRLPNILYISIKENIAIALWQFKGKLSLITESGEIIHFTNFNKFRDLPYLIGEDANLYAQSLIDNLSSYPNLYTKLKYAVRIGKRRWNLIFEGDLKVKMPEKNFKSTLHYLDNILASPNFLDKKYKILDARDSKKFYLKKN